MRCMPWPFRKQACSHNASLSAVQKRPTLAHPAQRRWYPLVFAIAALVLLPLSVLLLSWQTIDQQIWSHLWETQMTRLLGNTLTLVLGVGVGVTVLGVS